MDQPDSTSNRRIGSGDIRLQRGRAGRRYGTRGPTQSIRRNGRLECGSRGSRRVVASCDGRCPSVASDARPTRCAEHAVAPECVAAARSRVAAGHVAALAWLASACFVADLVVASAVVGRSVAADFVAVAAVSAAVRVALAVVVSVAELVAASAVGRAAAADFVAVAAEYAAVPASLARAGSLAVSDGPVFRLRAVHRQGPQFREATTALSC